MVNVFAPWWGGASILLLALIALRSGGALRATSCVIAGIVCLRLIVLFAAMPAATAASRHEPDLRVISFNIWKDNEDRTRVTRWLDKQDADVVILLEAPIGSENFDNSLRRRYPYHYGCARNGPCSTRIISKWPALHVRHFADNDPENRLGLSALSARLSVAGSPVTIVAVHMDRPWPLGRRDRRLPQMAAVLRQAKAPIVLSGDFNSAPWTVGQSRIVAANDLTIASGTKGTWPSWAPIPLLPLDQAYASPCVRAVQVKRGPHLGSDHQPLVMDFKRTNCGAN
ncbi:endonuclease/exonuclease/phosphatase family protein [Croceicoccus sediminis]|uniref:endonuclease/exonuclease/phosphatase family protein n=1 Tax=Croceicoccus sediminis TaxID=2571150 RepID=UPI0014789EAA|nr:endonuclease/exonuclease/phosphatase family protein [Croceicoccus sediminis]